MEVAGVGIPIPVVVADDHAAMRRSLLHVLESAPGIHVVGEAFDLAGAGEEIRRHRPRVLVLDLRLPGGSPIEAIRTRVWGAGTRIVATTMINTPSFATEAMRAGADAIVLKDNADAELLEAIHVAARGGRFVSPRLRRS